MVNEKIPFWLDQEKVWYSVYPVIGPGILLILTIASAIAGESYGFAGEAHLFTYFFMLVVLSKFVGGILKESMEDPSMNLIYQSLDPRERRNVQSGIEGVLSQIGVFTAGLFLACFVMISFVEIIHVTYIIVCIPGDLVFRRTCTLQELPEDAESNT